MAISGALFDGTVASVRLGGFDRLAEFRRSAS